MMKKMCGLFFLISIQIMSLHAAETKQIKAKIEELKAEMEAQQKFIDKHNLNALRSELRAELEKYEMDSREEEKVKKLKKLAISIGAAHENVTDIKQYIIELQKKL